MYLDQTLAYGMHNQKLIYLTVGIDAEDRAFAELDVDKIDCGILLSEYDLLKHTNEDRLKFLAIGILQYPTNIFVAHALYSADDIVFLNGLLKSKKQSIHKVYIPSPNRMDNQLREGQKMVTEHNRWLDYRPGEIEDIHTAFQNRLDEIQKRFSKSTIQIVKA
jgi:hypothetical protein